MRKLTISALAVGALALFAWSSQPFQAPAAFKSATAFGSVDPFAMTVAGVVLPSAPHADAH
jgi:hypothetical protein